MKKVVIAIALMLATSASWAAGSLASATATFAALGATNPTVNSPIKTNQNYINLYNTDKSNVSSQMQGGTLACYLIDFGTLENGYSGNTGEYANFVNAYKAGNLVVDYFKQEWSVGDTVHGDAFRFDMKLDSSGRINSTTLGTVGIDKTHYYAIVIFTDNNTSGTDTANTLLAGSKNGSGFYATGARKGSNADTSSFYFGVGSNISSSPRDVIGNDGSYGGSYAGWIQTSFGGSATLIPEPTSGLMILIGIASLALKRKRA